MKTTTPVQRVDEPAGATAVCLRREVVGGALTGFGVGAGSAAAYLLLGGEYVWDIPDWASVVFFPGFLAGFKVNEWGLSVAASKAVGVFAVGLTCAVLAVLARLAWFVLRHRPQSTALSHDSQ